MNFFKDWIVVRPLPEARDSSDCPAQPQQYNDSYRMWRADTKNAYSFHGNTLRSYAFVDGMGMESYQPKSAQKAAWRKLSTLLLMVVLLFFAADCLIPMLLLPLLRLCGSEVWYSYHEHVPYGDQYGILITLTVSNILRYLLPLWYVRRTLQLPRALRYPLQVQDHWSGFFCLMLSLLLFVLTDFGQVLHNTTGTLHVNTDIYYALNYMDDSCCALYLSMELLLIPTLAELLLRGAIFQACRQHGVWFAILVTALLEMTFTYNPISSFIIFPVSILSGLAVWMSGSVATNIAIHIIYRILRHVLFLSMKWQPIYGIPASWAVLLIILVVALIGCVILFCIRRPRYTDYRTFLTTRETLHLLIANAPIIGIWIINLLAMAAFILV